MRLTLAADDNITPTHLFINPPAAPLVLWDIHSEAAMSEGGAVSNNSDRLYNAFQCV